MSRGLATVSFWAADLAAAKDWYAELLGIGPYFERPGYAEFRLGDYQQELGLIDSRYAPAGPANGLAGAVVYWHVDDVTADSDPREAAVHGSERVRGAHRPRREVHHRFGGRPLWEHPSHKYNPHYLEVLGSTGAA